MLNLQLPPPPDLLLMHIVRWYKKSTTAAISTHQDNKKTMAKVKDSKPSNCLYVFDQPAEYWCKQIKHRRQMIQRNSAELICRGSNDQIGANAKMKKSKQTHICTHTHSDTLFSTCVRRFIFNQYNKAKTVNRLFSLYFVH